MTVSDRIRGKMAEQHVTAKEMARLFQITPQAWSYWLRYPERMTVGRLKVIAARLNTTPSYLIGG